MLADEDLADEKELQRHVADEDAVDEPAARNCCTSGIARNRPECLFFERVFLKCT